MKRKFLRILIATLVIANCVLGVKLYLNNRTSTPNQIKQEQVIQKHMTSIELKQILSVNKLETLNLKVSTSYKIKVSDKALFECLQGIANTFTTRESILNTNFTLHYTYNLDKLNVEETQYGFDVIINTEDVEINAEQTGINIIVNKKTFDGYEVDNKDISEAVNQINKEVKQQYNKEQYKRQCGNQAKENLNKLLDNLNIKENVNIIVR